jgi:hypothetical protein
LRFKVLAAREANVVTDLGVHLKHFRRLKN